MKPVRTVGIGNGGGDAPGQNVVGVPKTIDNDLDATEATFGFDTALVATEAVDRLRRFSLVVVAEGVKLPGAHPSGKPIPPAGPGNVANTIAFTLREMLHKEVRVTVLGQGWRGGSPTPFDRMFGTRLRVAATVLVARHQSAAWSASSREKKSVSLDEALEKMKYVDPSSEIVHAARSVAATFGGSA